MTEQEFFTMCKSHDYFYSMSDDHREYKRGVLCRDAIHKAIDENPRLKWIWVTYCDWMDCYKHPQDLEQLRAGADAA